MHRATFHQGWQLECERLTTTSRENGQQRLVFHSRSCCILLQRFTLVGSKLIITEELLQVVVDIKISTAIRTTLITSRMSKKTHTILYVRIVVQYPRWSNRTIVGGVYKSKRECKFCWLLSYDSCYVCMFTDFALKFFTNQLCKSYYIISFCSNKFDEPLEFRNVMQ